MHSITRKKLGVLVSLASVSAFSCFVHGAIITDPTLVGGSDAIDPSGSELIDTLPTTDSGKTAATQTEVEGVSGFQAIQSFSGFDDKSGATWDNIINFTDAGLADIAFETTTQTATSNNGDVASSTGRSTSGSSHIYTRNNSGGARSWGYLIDFGSYDTGSTTFDATANSVAAFAFTLVSLDTGHSATATFYDNDDNVLSVQSMIGNDTDPDVGGGAGTDGLFALVADSGSSIGKVSLLVNMGSGSSSIGMDDVGFAMVPEPSSLLLLTTAGIAVCLSRFRKLRKS